MKYTEDQKLEIVKMAMVYKEALGKIPRIALGIGAGVGVAGLAAKALQPYGTYAKYTDIIVDPMKDDGKDMPIYARSQIKRPLLFRKEYNKLVEKPKQYAMGMGMNPRETFKAMLTSHAQEHPEKEYRFKPNFSLHRKHWVEKARADKLYTKKDSGEVITDRKTLFKIYTSLLGNKK